MENKLSIYKLLIVNRIGLYQKRNLMPRTCPKLVLNGFVGITGNWQHEGICAYSLHNWFPDDQIFICVETMQKVQKRKDDIEKLRTQKEIDNKD